MTDTAAPAGGLSAGRAENGKEGCIMKFMDVKSTGCTLKLSKIAKGADHFGVTIPKERAFALMDRYLELGGNVIDTARLYGRARPFDAEFAHSEPIVGEWLRTRRNRDQVILVTKGAHPVIEDISKRRVNPECIAADLEISLKALGVDYVDIYFLHRDDPEKPVSEIMDALDEHVKAGKIRAIGASNWTCARIDEANAYARAHGKTPFAISQIQWCAAYVKPNAWPDPTIVSMNETEYAGYIKNGLPVMAFSPQANGYFSKLIAGEPLKQKYMERYDCPENRRRLEHIRALCEKTGKSPAAVSLAYITSNRVPGCAIIGCSTVEQLEDSMSDSDLTLTEADCAALV